MMCSKMVKDVGSASDLAPVNKKYYLGVVIGAIALSFVSAILLQHLFYAHAILVVVGCSIVFLYVTSHRPSRAMLLISLANAR